MFAEPGRQARGSFSFNGTSYFQYDGPTLGNAPHGYGTLHFQDGSCLSGNFSHGALNGTGVRRWENGSFYTGSFAGGDYHGPGRLIDAAKGLDLEGEFQFGQLHGQGSMSDIRRREYYTGEFVANRFHGQGKLEIRRLANGGATTEPYINEVVTGEFRNGKVHGRVSWRFANGDVFEGTAEDGDPHGQGEVRHAASSTVYRGPLDHWACAAVPNALSIVSMNASRQPLDLPPVKKGTEAPPPPPPVVEEAPPNDPLSEQEQADANGAENIEEGGDGDEEDGNGGDDENLDDGEERSESGATSGPTRDTSPVSEDPGALPAVASGPNLLLDAQPSSPGGSWAAVRCRAKWPLTLDVRLGSRATRHITLNIASKSEKAGKGKGVAVPAPAATVVNVASYSFLEIPCESGRVVQLQCFEIPSSALSRVVPQDPAGGGVVLSSSVSSLLSLLQPAKLLSAATVAEAKLAASPAARKVLLKGDSSISAVVTNGAASFSFSFLLPGNYLLVVSAVNVPAPVLIRPGAPSGTLDAPECFLVVKVA
jgi:hypothetical protein